MNENQNLDNTIRHYKNENKNIYDNLDKTLFVFSSDKNDIIIYLEYKQNRLYDFLNKKFNYLQKNDIIDMLNDIYYFKYNFIKDINKIEFDDYFYYKFDDIAKNIRYEYQIKKKYIKNMCY